MQEPKVKVELVIQQLDSGQIRVNGPINDRAICYALLELAKDVIRAYTPQQVESGPTIQVVRNLPNNGGR